MMPIFAAIMVPMIVTVSNMRFVFGVELHFYAHVLDDRVQAHSRGYHLQLQLFPASQFDIVESKETSSRRFAEHSTHMDFSTEIICSGAARFCQKYSIMPG